MSNDHLITEIVMFSIDNSVPSHMLTRLQRTMLQDSTNCILDAPFKLTGRYQKQRDCLLLLPQPPIWTMASSEYDWQAEKDDDDIVDMMVTELLSSSDEEEENKAPRSRKKNKDRNFPLAYLTVGVKDYFTGPESIYDEKDFERRFRVPRVIFNCIWEKLEGEAPFVHRTDALGKRGIYPLVRMVACFRHLAYGDGYDREDEYCRMSEDSVQNSVKAFCRLIKKHFPEYLNRNPSASEKEAIVQRNTERGFPGHFASWDCKHFSWHKCPMWLHGQHKGHA